MDITIQKTQDGEWTVWNKQNGKMAKVIKIHEFGILTTGKPRYRVDVDGRTVDSMIDHIQTAKSIARKQVV